MNHPTHREQAASADDEIVIRKATAEDIAGLIIPSWLSSYTKALPAKMMRADSRFGEGRERYWSALRGRIERVLATSTTSVRVADAQGTSAGWVCDDQSQRAVHYVYVKETFRRQGVGRQLAGWIDDGSKGTVALMAYPPPWFTMGSRDGTTKPLWRSHQIVDTITPV